MVGAKEKIKLIDISNSKFLFLLGVLLLCNFVVFSQIEQNTHVVGVNLNYSNNKEINQDVLTQRKSFGAYLKYGNFILDKWMLGAGIGVARNSSLESGPFSTTTRKHNLYALTPFTRYYTSLLNERLFLFGEFACHIEKNDLVEESHNLKAFSLDTDEEYISSNLILSSGIAYFPLKTKRLSAELKTPLVNYRRITKHRVEASEFNLFSNFGEFEFGLFYYF